ncbi:MAG: hypothetical protein ABFD75_06675 [Smithella sp.]
MVIVKLSERIIPSFRRYIGIGMVFLSPCVILLESIIWNPTGRNFLTTQYVD